MTKEITVLLCWLGVSLFFMVESWRMGMGQVNLPGSGFIPFWIAVMIGVLTIVQLARELSAKKRQEGSPVFRWSEDRNAFYVLIILFAIPFLLDKIGFVLTTLAFMLLCLRSIGRKSWGASLGLTLLVTVSAYFLFLKWLQILLPEGRWTVTLLSVLKEMLYGTR